MQTELHPEIPRFQPGSIDLGTLELNLQPVRELFEKRVKLAISAPNFKAVTFEQYNFDSARFELKVTQELLSPRQRLSLRASIPFNDSSETPGAEVKVLEFSFKLDQFPNCQSEKAYWADGGAVSRREYLTDDLLSIIEPALTKLWKSVESEGAGEVNLSSAELGDLSCRVIIGNEAGSPLSRMIAAARRFMSNL